MKDPSGDQSISLRKLDNSTVRETSLIPDPCVGLLWTVLEGGTLNYLSAHVFLERRGGIEGKVTPQHRRGLLDTIAEKSVQILCVPETSFQRRREEMTFFPWRLEMCRTSMLCF